MKALVSVLLMLGGFALLVCVVIARRMWRHVRQSRAIDPEKDTAKCRCGYPMEQLDLLRCPECGRVRGFDATAEELGLNEEQLRQAKQRADQRRLADQPVITQN